MCSALAPKNHVLIGVDIPPSDSPERWLYIEYLVVPMQEVIRKGAEVDLAWWVMRSNHSVVNESPERFLERLFRSGLHSLEKVSVRFGFWDNDAEEELVAMTWSKQVTNAFLKLTEGLRGQYGLRPLPQWEWEMVPEWGDVKATFSRTGPRHDVHFSYVGRGLP